MLTLLIAGPLAAVVLVFLARRLLPRLGLIVLGVVVIAAGVAAVAYVEWRYTPASTLLVQMRIPLGRAGAIRSPAFMPAISGPYDIWLEFDRSEAQEGDDFVCVTGQPGFEAACPRRDPALALDWSVAEDGAVALHGKTDWRDWHTKQAAIDPAEALRKQKAFAAYQAKSINPSDKWPRYYKLGTFTGIAAREYQVTLDIHQGAGVLAARHPNLAVGLGSAATQGIGSLALVFGLLCVITGAVLFLFTIPRGQT